MDSINEYPLDIDENDHARNILKKLNSMRQEQKHCNLIISAEEKEIHVNRDVMCAASDYFDAMLTHDTKEKKEGIVEMKDMKFSAIEKCVDFIYSGKISVSEDECEGLLYSASLMQLKQVCDKISPFLEGRLTLKSFFDAGIRRIAFKLSMEMLSAVCDEFASENLFELSEEEEFNSLDIEYVSFLLSSKKSSEKRLEDSKLAIALQWVKAELDVREKHLMKMVNLLDTSELTSGYAMFLVQSEPLCFKFPKFMKELSIGIALSHHVKVTGPPNISGISSAAEMTSPNSLVIFDETSKLVQLYQPSTNKLIRVTGYHREMDTYFTACMLEECLYIFNLSRMVFRLDIRDENSVWTRIADMLHFHGPYIQCPVLERFICVGGLDKMERYKIGENEKWEDVYSEGTTFNGSALVCYEECIFVIGGWNFCSLNAVTKFSPSSSTWTSVKSMNVARIYSSATLFYGKIYVAGGYICSQNICDFEVYDGVSDSWTILPKMISPRCNFSLCSVDNRIFAIGGRVAKCTIEVYDSENEKVDYSRISRTTGLRTHFQGVHPKGCS